MLKTSIYLVCFLAFLALFSPIDVRAQRFYPNGRYGRSYNARTNLEGSEIENESDTLKCIYMYTTFLEEFNKCARKFNKDSPMYNVYYEYMQQQEADLWRKCLIMSKTN